jgi:hypothetical protein|tara:strand:+ start:1525 stop:2286 length:762 start_codon:yes stop_codon:yes gene_type:complete
MAYTSFGGLAVILQRGPAFRAASTEALKVGDLVSKEFALADASAGGGSAYFVSLEDVDSGSSGLYAEWAVIRKPSTIAAGGVVTAGTHGGTLGDTLFLSTDAGDAVEVIDGDGIYQIVGQVLSTEDVMLRPSHAPGDFFQDCEKETTTKTLDINDSGKSFVATSTSDVVITIPATAAQGVYTIINGAQDGDHLTSVSPNASDGVVGWDFTNTDDGDATNTKATSKAGDFLVVQSGGLAGGFMVVTGRGVWAGA